MSLPEIYIAIAVAALAVIAVLMFFVNKGKKKEPMSKLTSLAFVFVISGVIFGDDRLISYSLMGFGILLAVVDIIQKRKK